MFICVRPPPPPTKTNRVSHASIPMYSAIPSTRLCYQCTQRPSTASIASEHDNTTHVKSRTHSLARMHAHNRTLRPPVAFARSLSLSLATSLSLSLWPTRTLAERTAVELLALVHVAHAHAQRCKACFARRSWLSVSVCACVRQFVRAARFAGSLVLCVAEWSCATWDAEHMPVSVDTSFVRTTHIRNTRVQHSIGRSHIGSLQNTNDNTRATKTTTCVRVCVPPVPTVFALVGVVHW